MPIIADDGRRPGLRDRRGQDHAGPRPRRPRDRPAPRSAGADDPRPTTRTITEHRDALRRARPVRGARARSSPTSRRAATSSASRAARDGHRPLPAQQRRHRAAAQDAVVHPDGAARGTRRSRRPAAGRTRILPERFEKTWEHWLTNIRDWNVSRQLWWGHRIPAWYCPDGHVTVSSDDRRARTPARSAAGRPPSSSRTRTSSTPGSARACGRSRRSAGRTTRPTTGRYYPTSVMETGYDIIFFWVARMMMLGHPADRTASRSTRSTCRASSATRYGQKMSKTKGNVVDPLGVIDESGADALRFALIHGATPGNDQRFGAGQARARPQLRQQALERDAVRGRAPGPRRSPRAPSGGCPDARHLGPAERWLLSRAAATTEAVDAAMAGLRLRRGHAAPLRGDLERVLRLGPRARQGPPGRRAARARTSARRPGGRWSRSSTRTCGCSTRSCRS